MQKALLAFPLSSLLTLACVGCSHTVPATSPSAASSPQHLTIVRLESRQYSIRIAAGPPAPLYTIATPDGQVLANAMTLADLRVTHHDLYDLFAPTICPEATASAANATPIIYAGAD